MRISGNKLNKKEENPYRQNEIPLYRQPVYQQPIVVQRNYTPIIVAGVVLSLVVAVPAFLMLVGVIGAVAIPNLLESRNAAGEARAVSELRTFHTAQATYQAAIGDGKYASFDELVRSNLITADKEFWTRPDNAYAYTLTRSIPSGDRYCIIADSLKSKKVFAVGSEGVVYYSETKDVTCANGELGGSGLKPLQ